VQEAGEVAQGRRYRASEHVAVQEQELDGGRQICQRLGDLPGQAILLEVQHVEVLHGAEALRDLASELVLAQNEHLEVGAPFHGRGDSSLQRVGAQVQELQPAETAELGGVSRRRAGCPGGRSSSLRNDRFPKDGEIRPDRLEARILNATTLSG
jgi:hypothetical protein